MSEIKDADSVPSYIGNFMNSNIEKLITIHDDEKEKNGIGYLGFNCSEKDNKMDVYYKPEKLMDGFEKEQWEQIKNTIGDKKLFLINDLDLKTVFLIYI
jgi:hypothetical protein